VINTGVAGSLDADIDIGDIVVSTDVVQHDFDITPLGFEPGELYDLQMVGIPADEVYRNAIRDAGEFTPLPIRADAVEEFSRVWGTKGTGWFVDILDDSKLPGYKLVRAYNGSSSYDTKQMSRLIDYVVQDAKSLDIETMTDRELSLLKEGWK
jgi:hypothetical protein